MFIVWVEQCQPVVTIMSNTNILDKFKELVNNAPASVLREIIKFSSNLLLEHEKPSSPQLSDDELDRLFKYIPDAFTNQSVDLSSSTLIDDSTNKY